MKGGSSGHSHARLQHLDLVSGFCRRSLTFASLTRRLITPTNAYVTFVYRSVSRHLFSCRFKSVTRRLGERFTSSSKLLIGIAGRLTGLMRETTYPYSPANPAKRQSSTDRHRVEPDSDLPAQQERCRSRFFSTGCRLAIHRFVFKMSCDYRKR